MPRSRSTDLIQMLVDFKIIEENEVVSFRMLFSQESTPARGAMKVINKLTGRSEQKEVAMEVEEHMEIDAEIRCTLEKMKIILIIQQIDCIARLVAISERLVEIDTKRKHHKTALINDTNLMESISAEFRCLCHNDYDVTTREDRLLTGNKELDQLYRESRAVKSSIKTILNLILKDSAAKEKILVLYPLRGLSAVASLGMRLLRLISNNKDWNIIREALQEDVRSIVLLFQYTSLSEIYKKFWVDINKVINGLPESHVRAEYKSTMLTVRYNQVIAAGCPTPSPACSPRACSPRACSPRATSPRQF